MNSSNKKLTGLIIFACTLITLFVFELYLRNKYRDQQPKKGYSLETCTHRSQKISLKNGSLKIALSPYTNYKNLTNQKTETLTINSSGFRGEEINPDSNLKRVICVGGSAAFGQGCNSDAETFEAILDDMNDRIEVINAGVVGFLSGQEFSYITNDLIDFNPDMIIAYNGWNDLFEAWSYKDYTNRQKYKDEFSYNVSIMNQLEKELLDNYQSKNTITGAFKRLFFSIFNKSYIMKNLFSKWRSEVRFHYYDFGKDNNLKDKPIEEYLHEVWQAYINNIVKMQAFCAYNGVAFLVVLQPELGQKRNLHPEERITDPEWSFGFENYREEFPGYFAQFIAKSKEKFDELGINYLDINAERAFIESNERLFQDAVHTNFRGNQIIAGILNEKINEILVK